MNLHSLHTLAAMSAEGRMTFKMLAIMATVAMIPLGLYFFKNQKRWFGHDPEVPWDGSGPREYERMQTWVLYWGMLAVFAFFAMVF